MASSVSALMTTVAILLLIPLMEIMLRILTLCGYALIEALIQYISSGIQNARLSKIYYWTTFAVSRFVFVTIDSWFVFEIQGEEMKMANFWRDYILLPFLLWVSMKICVFFEKRLPVHHPSGKDDCMNWIQPGLSYHRLRHHHLPIFDSIRCIYALYRLKRNVLLLPYKMVIAPVTMMDSYWPECSTIHSIRLFICEKCTKDNGFYLLRSSNLRQKVLFRYLTPCSGAVNGTWFNAIYQGGLILINVVDAESQKCYSYDIRNDRFSTEFVIKPRVIGELCWTLLDDGKELGQQRNASSTYFRMIYRYGQGVGHPFAYGQCLFEISEDKRTQKRHFVRYISYPWPWLFQSHKPFITSTGQVGMQTKVRDATSTGEVTWKTCVVFDPKSFMLKAMPGIEDLMETDRPLRLYAQHYLKNNDVNFLPCASVLNESKALIIRYDGKIWHTTTTRFQPPSLKSICSEKIFKAYGLQLSKFSATDWLRVTGVDVWPHFPGQK